MLQGQAELDRLSRAKCARLEEISVGLGVPPDTIDGTLALWLASAGRYPEALDAATRVTSRPERAPTRGTLVGTTMGDAYAALFRVYAAAGDPIAARDAFERACSLYRAAGHYSQLARTIVVGFTMVSLTYFADEIADRRRLLEAAEEAVARAGGLAEHPLPVRGIRLGLLSLEGDWGEIERLADGFRAASRDDDGYTVYAAMVLALVAYRRGDAALAWEYVHEVLPEGSAQQPGGGSFFYATVLQRLAAKLAIDAGDLDAAGTWLAAQDRWLEWSGSTLGRAEREFNWALLERARGNPVGALERALRSMAHASEPRQPLALMATRILLGELATAAGQLGEAGTHLEHALALANACDAPYERTLTRLALADLKIASGSIAGSAGIVAEAASELERLGVSTMRDRARSLARQAGLESVDGHERKSVAGLTARELEVLRHLSAGRTNQEIADALFVSAKTVENHVSHILAKTASSNRAAAAAFAQRHGLV